jgi:hypothetical protein
VGFSYALFLIERARVYSFADGDVERMRVYAKEAVTYRVADTRSSKLHASSGIQKQR